MNFTKKMFKTIFFLLLTMLFACNVTSLLNKDEGDDKIELNLSATISDSFTRLISPTATPDISGYELYGAISGETQILLNSYALLTDAIVSLDTGTWDFTLKALNSSNEIFLSGEQTGVVLNSSPVSIAFVLKSLSTGTGSINVTVNWPNTVPVDSVITSFNGSTVSPALSISENSVSFSKEDVATGSYVLSFSLNNAGGSSLQIYTDTVAVYPGMDSSATISLTADSFNSAPTAPTGLSASYQAGTATNGVVNLTWTDNSTSESGFQIYLADETTPIGTVDPGQESFSDTSAIRGTTRTYNILAVNDIGDSALATSESVIIPWLASFDSRGGSSIDTIESSTDFVVTAPTNPTRTDYTFRGWYKESECTNKWTFNTDTVSANTTLYAKWTANNGISATISIWNGDTVSFSNTLTITKGSSLTITVQETFSNYTWYLDGQEKSGETSQSIIITTSSLVAGRHELMLTVKDSTGKFSSARCQFTVNN